MDVNAASTKLIEKSREIIRQCDEILAAASRRDGKSPPRADEPLLWSIDHKRAEAQAIVLVESGQPIPSELIHD